MSDCHDREQLSSLIISTIDNLEQMVRARELTSIIWDVNIEKSKIQQNWIKTEILLESYERTRDESLESALSNLKELIEIMAD